MTSTNTENGADDETDGYTYDQARAVVGFDDVFHNNTPSVTFDEICCMCPGENIHGVHVLDRRAGTYTIYICSCKILGTFAFSSHSGCESRDNMHNIIALFLIILKFEIANPLNSSTVAFFF